MRVYVTEYPKFVQLIILWAASGLFSSVYESQAIVYEDAIDLENLWGVSTRDAKIRKGRKILSGGEFVEDLEMSWTRRQHRQVRLSLWTTKAIFNRRSQVLLPKTLPCKTARPRL